MPLRFAIACAVLVACGAARAQDPGTGPSPALPAPHHALIPHVDIAPAVHWPAGAMPTPAPGLAVTPLATGLDHPRWLYVLPNGDVLVAESNGPAGKSGIRGIKGWVMKHVMAKAGAGVPSPERIVLLRDADGDGRAELRSDFLSGLHSPFGMALVGDTLYVANTDALVRVPYAAGATRIDATPEHVVDLPGATGEFNHHWTKSLVASPDGTRLYVGVGSNSNVGENGMAVEASRAAILEIDPRARTTTVFADGLRNPVGIAWQPGTSTLWAVVNERDELGNDLVPDYLTQVERGAFYGWPYSYWGAHVDARVSPERPDRVAAARVPDYGLGNHVAPLGLTFNTSATLQPTFGDGAFVGRHGSWNRTPLSGYDVVFVPLVDGRPQGAPREVLAGFVDAEGNARGRPVGVAIARDGALLVADDVGNAIWRVSPSR
ncbi:sorbosone dehydrogenase family protein [Lysobacter sp. TY2-98]|uniref:PQQ-dependent sugar dehydrogenase n=1 Tax=Lysobacter sp. TY2-98 TaxID=2290922 RepID=UPI000E205F9E|nr:sorbosone dehydrogenase family protein [Lysobacter sp. TY2-98]AXK72788.1 sorbosone dehydrogenase family protein [Lysobacter sp. TY2-98]